MSTTMKQNEHLQIIHHLAEVVFTDFDKHYLRASELKSLQGILDEMQEHLDEICNEIARDTQSTLSR